jgi:hypothetical protein
MLGRWPFTLQRVLELTAAYEVLGNVPYAQDKERLRRKLAHMPLHSLHGAVAHVLAHIPARRIR